MPTENRIKHNHISFVQALMYGDCYDAAIHVMVKESRTVAHILKQHCISVMLAVIANSVEAAEKDYTPVADVGAWLVVWQRIGLTCCSCSYD